MEMKRWRKPLLREGIFKGAELNSGDVLSLEEVKVVTRLL